MNRSCIGSAVTRQSLEADVERKLIKNYGQAKFDVSSVRGTALPHAPNPKISFSI